MLNKKMWMVAALVVGGMFACGGTDNHTPDPCGDNVCSPGETRQSCPDDCDLCGNGDCDVGETLQNCEMDCEAQGTCGNQICETGESSSCPADCAPPPPPDPCGNGVCAATETITSCAADCGARLRVQNSSSYTVYYLYLKRCNETAWSPDQLGASVIAPNQAFTLGGIPPGCWHFRATDLNAAHVWLRTTGTELFAGMQFTWTLLN